MKPYYERGGITIYHGDCREILPQLDPVAVDADVVIADPPYGETSLIWDERVAGWIDILPCRNLWVFGSMRFFLVNGAEFGRWHFAQDIVWEKQNGTVFHADRFRRIHEHVCQFYKDDWGSIYKSPVHTLDAVARVTRRKARPPHTGSIDGAYHVSQDGGPRLQRSIIRVVNCHGEAEHPTQKPIGIIVPLLEYSCPEGGLVLDPMMGSGTVLRAAKDLGRRAVGIEIEERYCEIAAKRLMQDVLL